MISKCFFVIVLVIVIDINDVQITKYTYFIYSIQRLNGKQMD